MQPKILSQAAETVLAVERQWLSRLQVALAQFPATDEDRAVLDRSVRQLDELFLLVVVGEFNSGKSALINALFGEPLLEMGVTPTTTRVHVLRYGKAFERVAVDAEVDVFSVPAALLEEITIVDTPGTNAIYREHEAMTRDFLPRSDLVLFVTSVDRPFTESERAFLEMIREWGKKVVVVLNKIDILEDPGELESIERFVRENVQALLGFAPEAMPVSARTALRAKQAQDAEALAVSRIEALEAYIIDRLDEKERVRLKLLNPLGVGLHMTGKYLGVVDGRMALLKDDFSVMDNITQQLGVYREDMSREFSLRLSDVDRQLQIFENRGVAFFDETMRLAHFFDLLDRPRLEAQFREQVISDIPEAIEERVDEITEWLVARNQTQWQRVMEAIRRRKEVHADHLLGEIPSTFERNRKELIENVGLAAQEALQTYDQEGEAYRIALSLKNAVANTALVEVGAVGLGTLIAVIASSTVLDVTGVLAATTMAVLGLFVIPSRRRRLKDELRRKIAEVRETLMETLTTQYESEVARSTAEIETAISPYSRFVRSQQQHWSETREEMGTIEKWLKRQESEIQAL
ncbi:MAG: dynamin family protein [Anaerolineae bacterium]|jgi:small GTP-binding protein|nr:dynamin family protein [Anaerolineae bacterium]